MSDERAKILRDGIVDGLAVLAMAVLVYAGKMPGDTGALAIVGLAGGAVVARTLTSTLGSRFSVRPPPPSILPVLAFTSAAWMAARVVGLSGALAACVAGCGATSGSPSSACTAVRSARAAAELAEPYVCEMPDGSVAP